MFGNIKIENEYIECKTLITLEDYIENYSLSYFKVIKYQLESIFATLKSLSS